MQRHHTALNAIISMYIIILQFYCYIFYKILTFLNTNASKVRWKCKFIPISTIWTFLHHRGSIEYRFQYVHRTANCIDVCEMWFELYDHESYTYKHWLWDSQIRHPIRMVKMGCAYVDAAAGHRCNGLYSTWFKQFFVNGTVRIYSLKLQLFDGKEKKNKTKTLT